MPASASVPAAPRSGRRPGPSERRDVASPVQLRDGEGDGSLPKIVGYGAVFGVWTLIGGMFEESIRKGAFKNALDEGQDVRCLFNHDQNLILGRTAEAATLRLAEDDTGLAYECDTPDVSYARDLVVSLGRKDVSQSSFAFVVRPGGAIWTLVEGGAPDGGNIWRREIIDADLYDVSPVTYPAYLETSSGLRSRFADVEPALRSLAAEQQRRGLPVLDVEQLRHRDDLGVAPYAAPAIAAAAPDQTRSRWLWLSSQSV